MAKKKKKKHNQYGGITEIIITNQGQSIFDEKGNILPNDKLIEMGAIRLDPNKKQEPGHRVTFKW